MTYAQIRATNWSLLKNMGVSPLQYQWRKDHPLPDSPAFALGRAVHCGILEPERWESEYVVYSGKVRRGKEWDQFKADHPDAEILSRAEMETARGCIAAVEQHGVAQDYLTADGVSECILQWVDDETGLMCKGRADRITDRVIDVKTSRDTTNPLQFARTCANLGYHGQMAFYYDGAAAMGLDCRERPVIIAVDPNPPHEVVVYPLTDKTLAQGAILYRRLLDRLARCMESDTWVGVCPGEIDLDLPTWYTAEGAAWEQF